MATDPECNCGGNHAAYVMDTTAGAGHAVTCPVRIAHPLPHVDDCPCHVCQPYAEWLSSDPLIADHEYRGTKKHDDGYCDDAFCSGHNHQTVHCSCGWHERADGGYGDDWRSQFQWTQHVLAEMQRAVSAGFRSAHTEREDR